MPTTWTTISAELLGFRLFKKVPGAKNMKKNEGLFTLYTVQCTTNRKPKAIEKWKKQMPTLKENRHSTSQCYNIQYIRCDGVWCTHFVTTFTKSEPNRREMKRQQQSFSFIMFFRCVWRGVGEKGQLGKDRNMYSHSHSHMYVTVVLSLSLRIYIQC